MSALGKYSIYPSQSVSAMNIVAPAKRAVPKLNEAQIAFHGGLGKTSAFSLASKGKLSAPAKKATRLA